MAAKVRAAQRRLQKLKSRRTIHRGGPNVLSKGELKGLPKRYYKRGPALPPHATRLTPEGHKFIKHGQMERHTLGSDTRYVKSSPFMTGAPLF